MSAPIPIQKPRQWPRRAYVPMVAYRLLRRGFGPRGPVGWRDQWLTKLWQSVGKAFDTGFPVQWPKPLLKLNPEIGYFAVPHTDLHLQGFEALQKEAEDRILQTDVSDSLAATAEGKKYKVKLSGDLYANPIDDLFTQFALQPELLSIVQDYLGVTPRLHSTELTLDMPIGGDPVSSQYWHHDGLDHRLVKVFVYLRDVTKATGHLATLAIEDSRRQRWELTRDPRFSKRAPLRNEYVESTVDRSKIVFHRYSAGTVIIADTATLLHRGLPQLTRPRLMFVATYTSPLPYEEWPRHPFAQLGKRPSKP